MKKFKIIFWRGNPQLKNGGYEMVEYCRAKTLEGATKKANKYCRGTIYGSLSVMKIVEVESIPEAGGII